MRAVRFHGPGDLRVEDVPEPVPGLDDVLIRPRAVGVCGTDVHILDGGYPARAPVTLGHEVAGQVVTVGSAVAGVSVGDLVTVQPNLPCDTCPQCRQGMEHLCDNRLAFGVELDGGMADLLLVPARAAYPVPAGTPWQVAALAEPLACCVHGMDRLAPRSGLPLLVCGCGPAGVMLIALARLSGLAPIVAADPRADRRDLALRFGADLALDPTEPGFEGRARSRSRCTRGS